MAGPSAYRVPPHTLLLGLTLLAACILLMFISSGAVDAAWIAVPFLLYAVICGVAAATIRANFFLRAVHHGKSAHAIALTFDDGPHNILTASILDILNEQKVPAAFFLIGKNAAGDPALVKRMIDEGHIVGNHTYHHSFHFDWQSSKAMEKEIAETDGIIQSITGKKPLLFRPPYGVTNPMLAAALGRSGHHAVGWSLRSLDTRIHTPQKLISRVVPRLKGGDIILLHDRIPNTADTLTALIAGARDRGFTFVPLDSLIPVRPYA